VKQLYIAHGPSLSPPDSMRWVGGGANQFLTVKDLSFQQKFILHEAIKGPNLYW